MKNQLTFIEMIHAGLTIFMNNLDLIDSTSLKLKQSSSLCIIYLPDHKDPFTGTTFLKALALTGLNADNIPENIQAFVFENAGKEISIRFPLPYKKIKLNAFSIEDSYRRCSSFFTNEILSPVEKHKLPDMDEKHCFLVTTPNQSDPFVSETLEEALELSGYNLNNIPEELCAFEFRSDKKVIYFKYALPSLEGIPAHYMQGNYFCSPSSRGLAQIIRNQNKKD